jgi:hypothetical protein
MWREMWSLVVLRGVHLQSQIDAAPIGCGDVKAPEKPYGRSCGGMKISHEFGGHE